MLDETIIKEMVREGIVFGHKRSKTHPKMKPFLGGTKNEIELLNPEHSYESLVRAAAFLKEKKAAGGVFMLLGTRPAGKKAIREFADEFGYPYVTSRWLGGTLTNFGVIRKRITYYEDLKEKTTKGLLEKYTKKEQRKFAEQAEKMKENFEGLRPLTKLPDALIVVDQEAHDTAVREAKRVKVPVVALIDTNDDPTMVEYPIFANDHSAKSVQWVIEFLKKEIR